MWNSSEQIIIYRGTPLYTHERYFFLFRRLFLLCLCICVVKIFLAMFGSLSAFIGSFLRTFSVQIKCRLVFLTSCYVIPYCWLRNLVNAILFAQISAYGVVVSNLYSVVVIPACRTDVVSNHVVLSHVLLLFSNSILELSVYLSEVRIY